jgi:DNA-binding NarL/FixJ family response regulator
VIVKSVKVMMVEDDDFIRATLRAALENRGFENVFDTAQVREALEFAKSNEIDIAILDYNLGKGPNGIDLANGLRKIHPTVAIILLTAFVDPSHLESRLAEMPSGSRILLKNSVSNIEILVEEIKSAIEAMK